VTRPPTPSRPWPRALGWSWSAGPKQRTWTDADGTDHQVTEIDAEEVGPSLRWATATLTRTNGPSRSGKASGQQAPTPF
jgi:single-stranded DNA-binding protein